MTGRLSGLLAGLMLLTTAALGDGDLFVAEAPVADELSETRNAVLSQLLSEVMIRVSGNTGIAAQPAAKAVLAAAPSLVQQYRYQTASDGDEVERVLWARFEQGGVERMMREQGLPVWSQRPRVLIWLAAERGARRELLNLDNEPEARAALLARAAYRGMPVQLPLMDLEDQAQLAVADLWSDYRPGLRQASARYPHDVIVAGRLQASGSKWRGTWSLHAGDALQTFETPAQSLPDALGFAADQVQNLLAARLAPMTGADGGAGTLVRVADVRDLPAYARLIGYLQGLSVVSTIALREARDDTVTIEVRLRGSEDDLRRALDVGSEVVAEPGGAPLPVRPAAAGAAVAPRPADLYYRLRN